jgi:hypothetical protein
MLMESGAMMAAHSRNSCVVAEGYLGRGAAEGAAAVAAEDAVEDAVVVDAAAEDVVAEGVEVPSVVAAEATLAHGLSSWASVDPRRALAL